MAKRTVITNKGQEILASSSQSTGQYWWIGYYGLAYVPNLLKGDSVDVPSEDLCDTVNSEPTEPGSGDSYNGSWVTETDTDQVVASMTRLTTYGDMIYNIFQGDLVGTGYYNCVSDGSAGGDLFGLTMYNTNIKKHYRYVLNEYGNNTLVSWIDEPSDTTGYMLGKYAYLGTDGYGKSQIPIPAPLYYLGNTSNDSVDMYFPDFSDEVTNGSSIYPYIETWAETPILDGLTLKDASKIYVPKVSVDYREYLDSQGYTKTHVYTGNTTNNPTYDGGIPRTMGGQYFDSLEIASDVDTNFDNTSWFAANLTMLSNYNEAGTDSVNCREFWKLHSISNYNKYHAPVGTTGHVLSSDLSNRNMSKVTKFFPISNYKVITTESGNNSSGDAVEFATGISISIDLDLAPRVKAQGFDDACDYDETANLTFFDKYDLSEVPEYTQTVQPYHDGVSSEPEIKDQFDRNIFDTSHTSFKFNRIGIYAVSLRKCPFIKDPADPIGKDVIIQFEINPDIEPILYAVVDWDNTVHLDDTGNGIHQFRADINLNIESPAGNLDADALVRDSTIFYNMYEDDAIKWYQNQLIATASTQNAITELSVKVAHMESTVANALNVCPPTDLSKKYSPREHNHPFYGLRHFFDGINHGTLRGINTRDEASEVTITENAFLVNETIYDTSYFIGTNSVAFGGANNRAHNSTESSVMGGITNVIYDSYMSSILNGESNTIGDLAYRSHIGSGQDNRLAHTRSSMIGTGADNIIKLSDVTAPSRYCAILSGIANTIETENSSVIGSGYNNTITGSVSSISDVMAVTAGLNSILGGSGNAIQYGKSCTILAGVNNSITGTVEVDYSGILSGGGNSITDSDNSAICSGTSNSISGSSRRSFIGSGYSGSIAGCDSSAILGGYNNDIDHSHYASILAGTSNKLIEASYAGIFAGSSNEVSADYGIILGGRANYINTTAPYAIVSGNNARATAYGEISHAVGYFAESGDAQLTKLLFKNETVTNAQENLNLGNGISYNFSNHYLTKMVSFCGTASIHGFVEEIVYSIGTGVAVSDIISEISTSNGSSIIYISRYDFPGTEDFYVGIDDMDARMIISGTGTALDGTWTFNPSVAEEDENGTLGIDVGTPASSTILYSTAGATVTFIIPSVCNVSQKFIGYYNGVDNASSITIDSTVTTHASTGIFNGSAAGGVEGQLDLFDPDDLTIVMENNYMYPSVELSGHTYLNASSIKWMANVEMTIMAEDTNWT